jgi:hypothetical protein
LGSYRPTVRLAVVVARDAANPWLGDDDVRKGLRGMTEIEGDEAERLQRGRDEERAERDEAIAERIRRDQKLTESLADGSDGTKSGSVSE